MAELLQIWGNNDLLLGASAPPAPYNIPNVPSAKTLKINNQSRNWLMLSRTGDSIIIDRVEPFSFLIMPFKPDLTLSVDVTKKQSTSLIPDNQYVDYTTMEELVSYQKGSIQFSGASLSDVSSIYNGIAGYTFPAGTTTQSIEFPFLPPGNMVDFHKGYFYISSSNGVAYTIQQITCAAQFGQNDFLNITGSPVYTPLKIANNMFSVNGAPMIANVINMVITVPSNLSAPDPIDLYYLIDAADTAIETPPGFGVQVQPTSTNMLDGSGIITLANVSQQILANDTSNSRRYIFFQNLSDTDMYINFSDPATVGAFGNIWVAPAGGSISFEAGFCPVDALSVICSVAGKYFTLKYVQ